MRTGSVRTRGEFAALRERGARSRRGPLRVQHVPAGPDGPAGVRVAFAVGRPVGTAVVRNRLRRRLRVALADLAPAPGLYLIGAAPSAARSSYSDLHRDLAAALAEIGAR